MIHLRSVEVAAGGAGNRASDSFAFNVPAIRAWGKRAFEEPITFLVGENGSGKSTFLEALAWASEAVGVGSEPLDTDASLAAARPLGRSMQLVWNRRPRRGFFLRAEDFFGYVKSVKADVARFDREAAELRAEVADLPDGEYERIAAPYTGSSAALRGRYGEDFDARSHGEQFLDFFQSRLVPRGLYLLDEPEAPLSPARQLALISVLKQAAEENESQFVIATHSPMLLATPGASILSFDDGDVRSLGWDELEHVKLVRDFLNRPDSYLRHL